MLINLQPLKLHFMKKITLITVMTIVCVGTLLSSFGQSSATAGVTATLITPITIASTQDMAFGKLSFGAIGGTAIIATGGTTSTTGDIKFIHGGAPTAAQFTVTGEKGEAYSISLPTPFNLTSAMGGHSLELGSFTSNPAATAGAGLIDASTGTQIIYVGATLTIPAGSNSGQYSNTTAFTVTVNYY